MGKFQTVAAATALVPLIVSNAAHTQTIQPADRLSNIEQRFSNVPVPSSQASDLPIVRSITVADEASVRLAGVKLVGNTVLSEGDLEHVWKPFIGKQLGISQLKRLADAVAAAYRQQGYLFTTAVVPPQSPQASNAVITIRVVEGFIEEVVWPKEVHNYVGRHASHRDVFAHYTKKMTEMRPLHVHRFKRYILLANDLPGLTFSSTIEAGSQVGGMKVTFDLDHKKHEVVATIDNTGSDASGPAQLQLSGTLYNSLGLNDEINVSYSTTLEDDLFEDRAFDVVSGNYKQVLNGEGLTLDVNASWSKSSPQTASLQALDYESEALSGSVALTYPFIRREDLTVSGTAKLSSRDTTSEMLGSINSRDRLRTAALSMTVDHADTAFSGAQGQSQAKVEVTQGLDMFGASDGDALQSRSSARADFTKVRANLVRTQKLPSEALSNFEVYAHSQFQWTDDPLFGSEQCSYGGRVFGRGFNEGGISGDRCALGSLELRYDIPQTVLQTAFANLGPKYIPQIKTYGFADRGYVETLSPASGTTAKQKATSFGGGVRWQAGEHYSGFAEAARTEEGGTDNDWKLFGGFTAKF